MLTLLINISIDFRYLSTVCLRAGTGCLDKKESQERRRGGANRFKSQKAEPQNFVRSEGRSSNRKRLYLKILVFLFVLTDLSLDSLKTIQIFSNTHLNTKKRKNSRNNKTGVDAATKPIKIEFRRRFCPIDKGSLNIHYFLKFYVQNFLYNSRSRKIKNGPNKVACFFGFIFST